MVKKKKKWMRPRHRVVRNIAYCILRPYMALRYGIRIERFREQGDRQYLVLFNHQTPFDQFFVGSCIRGPVYYLASEDLFSKGWVSSLIRYLVAPIPIKKQTTDVSAVLNCIRVAREGATIALAPEGNRTYSGKTRPFKASIVPLIRKLKLPVVVFRIEGGYGAEPRWSNVIRHGPMRVYAARVIEPETVAALNDEALYAELVDALAVDESTSGGLYPHKRAAEYLERAVYVCPHCGLAAFRSEGDRITCQTCGLQARYLPDKTLVGVGGEFPFRTVADWYDYQEDFVRGLDLSVWLDTPLFRDTVCLREVVLNRRKKVLFRETESALWGDRITVGDKVIPFDAISTAAVLGRNKLNLYVDGKVYQFKGDRRFNALKYVNIYYHHQNQKEVDRNGEFLGL